MQEDARLAVAAVGKRRIGGTPCDAHVDAAVAGFRVVETDAGAALGTLCARVELAGGRVVAGWPWGTPRSEVLLHMQEDARLAVAAVGKRRIGGTPCDAHVDAEVAGFRVVETDAGAA